MQWKTPKLHVPHNKNTSNKPAVPLAPPPEVLVLMSQHGGPHSVPVVQVGDHVLVGQLIAEAGEGTSVPCYAPISGDVAEIAPNSKGVIGIRIVSDGKMELTSGITPPVVTDLESFLMAVKASGVVGLGGAAYPLWGKFSAARRSHIKTILVNAAECEPYLTCDERIMMEETEWLVKGCAHLRDYLGVEEIVFGIEDNKPHCIEKLKDAFKDDATVTIKPLKALYPQGAKQILLYTTVGKVVEPGQRMAALGVNIMNVASLAKMAEYIETGMPFVKRKITVDGPIVRNPVTFTDVPNGTSAKYLIEQAGGLTEEAAAIVFGGPMTGAAQESMDVPVLKATGGILCFGEKHLPKAEATPCIHCGRCVANCPVSLNPVAFAKAAEMSDPDEKAALLTREQIDVCINCFSCGFVCPAHKPFRTLLDQNKKFLKKYNAEKAEKEKGGETK